MIAESTYESNENLKKLVDAEEGILDDVGSGASAALGAGVGVAGTAGAIGAAKALKSKPGGIVQKSKDAIKKGASKAGNLAKTAVRGAGRVFLPLAAALAIFDTAQQDQLWEKKGHNFLFCSFLIQDTGCTILSLRSSVM